MPRKPNYAFERSQRAKAKAAKREAKRQAKLAARTEGKAAPAGDADAESSRTGSFEEPPRR